MPVFTIQTPSGQKLDIQADNQELAIQGAQNWENTNTQGPGIASSLAKGASDVASGALETAHQYLGSSGAGDLAEGARGATADTPDPQLIKQGGNWWNPSDWNVGQLPAALAQGAPGLATDATVGKVAGRILGPEAALPAALASYWFRNAGNNARNLAVQRTGDQNATANPSELQKAGVQTGVETLPQAIGLPGVLAKTAKVTGIGQAAGNLLKTAAAEGAGSALGSAGGQLVANGQIDPNQVAASGVTGALTAGALKAGGAMAAANNARVFSAIDNGNFDQAATNFANRIQQRADGSNLRNVKNGFQAFSAAKGDVSSELSSAISDAQKRGVQLDQDTQNSLRSIQQGQNPTDADYQRIGTALQGDPGAQHIMDLVQQNHIANMVGDLGTIHDGKFAGGVSNKISQVWEAANHSGKAILGTMLAEATGSHILAHSPEALAAGFGVYGASRLLDRLTGARSPANRFVSRYADQTGNVRVPMAAPLAQAQAAPAAPGGAGAGPQATPAAPPGPAPTGTAPNGPWNPRPPIGVAGQRFTPTGAPINRSYTSAAPPPGWRPPGLPMVVNPARYQPSGSALRPDVIHGVDQSGVVVPPAGEPQRLLTQAPIVPPARTAPLALNAPARLPGLPGPIPPRMLPGANPGQLALPAPTPRGPIPMPGETAPIALSGPVARPETAPPMSPAAKAFLAYRAINGGRVAGVGQAPLARQAAPAPAVAPTAVAAPAAEPTPAQRDAALSQAVSAALAQRAAQARAAAAPVAPRQPVVLNQRTAMRSFAPAGVDMRKAMGLSQPAEKFPTPSDVANSQQAHPTSPGATADLGIPAFLQRGSATKAISPEVAQAVAVAKARARAAAAPPPLPTRPAVSGPTMESVEQKAQEAVNRFGLARPQAVANGSLDIPEFLQRTKVTKSNGKISERALNAVRAQATAAYSNGGAYTPLEGSALWQKGMSDTEAAEAQAQRLKDAGELNGKPSAYARAVERGREYRNGLRTVAAAHPEDAAAIDSLVEQLNHIKDEPTAKNAIAHYTKQMSKPAALAVRLKLSPGVVRQMWSRNEQDASPSA